jgi:hypothetical protein
VTEDFVLPELAESVVEGEVVRWMVAEGDRVVVDQPLVEVMTDKVTVELPAPFAGVLLRILAPRGPWWRSAGCLGRSTRRRPRGLSQDGVAPGHRPDPRLPAPDARRPRRRRAFRVWRAAFG